MNREPRAKRCREWDNMKITKKRTTFAPVTSVSLRRDGLHVVTPGRTDNRAVKRKAAPDS